MPVAFLFPKTVTRRGPLQFAMAYDRQQDQQIRITVGRRVEAWVPVPPTSEPLFGGGPVEEWVRFPRRSATLLCRDALRSEARSGWPGFGIFRGALPSVEILNSAPASPLIWASGPPEVEHNDQSAHPTPSGSVRPRCYRAHGRRTTSVGGQNDGRPTNLMEFMDGYQTEDDCREALFAHRWPEGFTCPRCSYHRAYPLPTRPLYDRLPACEPTPAWGQPGKMGKARSVHCGRTRVDGCPSELSPVTGRAGIARTSALILWSLRRGDEEGLWR